MKVNGYHPNIVVEKATDEFIVFGKPDISEEEIEAVQHVLMSGWLSTGKVAKMFEKEFGSFLGTGYPVAVSSCTDGLVASLIAAGVCIGHEVITTPMTFAATVNAILLIGAFPVFVDTDERGQLDADQIERVITERTRAIVPVHYTGDSPDMDKILALAKKHDLAVIEDAAHSFGGTYRGQPQGTLGDYGCFSFYPTKNITCGEGGMVVCRTEEHAYVIREIISQGLSSNAYKRYGTGPVKRYDVKRPGIKANLSDLHAAIGLTQLRRWPSLRAKRDMVWHLYESNFGLRSREHSRHLYTIRHKKRDALREYLHGKGIGTGIHFQSLHLEPAFKSLGYKPNQFPNAEAIGQETVSLPVSSSMTVDDAKRVIRAVKEFGEGK